MFLIRRCCRRHFWQSIAFVVVTLYALYCIAAQTVELTLKVIR